MSLIANVHCHFMNTSHVPKSYFDAKNIFGKIEAEIVRSRSFLDVNNFWFKGRTIDNYITLGQYKYENVRDEDTIRFAGYDNTGYQIITPLMMNMVAACNTSRVKNDQYAYIDPFLKPDSSNEVCGVSPFRIQVQEYSLLAALYPYRVFPFVLFNPLVEGNLHMCQDAIKDLGFIGVKMYPAHGYSPDPFDYLINKNEDTLDLIKTDLNQFDIYGQRLIEFYRWANDLQLPITVHCQYSSMQKTFDLKDQDLISFNNPLRWERVLRAFTKIRINFAHFGGDEYALSCSIQESLGCVCDDTGCDQIETDADDLPYCKKIRAERNKPERELSYSWIQTIIKLAEANPDRVFSDIAAHYYALSDSLVNLDRQKDRERYVNHIRAILMEAKRGNVAVQMMFGTDTPVKTIENVSDKQFLENYTNIINPLQHSEFYWDNAIRFLFGKDRVIPLKYKKFLFQADNRYCIRRDDETKKRDLKQLELISSDNGQTVRSNQAGKKYQSVFRVKKVVR